MKVKSLSRVQHLAWTAAYPAPPSMGFSRQEYWSGVPLPYGLMTALNRRASVAAHALLKIPELTSATHTLKLEQYTENNMAPVHK